MDPEIKKALANIKRRKAEIYRKHGGSEDSGPVYGRSRSDYRRRLAEERDDFDFDFLEEDELS